MRSFEELIAQAQRLGRRRLAVVFMADPELLLAVERAIQTGVARPLFLGRGQQVSAEKEELGLVFEDERLEAPGEEAAVDLAARLIVGGEADIAAVGSSEAARALSERIDLLSGLPDSSPLSRVLLFRPEGWDRLFLLAFPSPEVKPEPEHMRLVIRRAVAIAHRLGTPTPGAALIRTGGLRGSDRWAAWGIDLLQRAARQEGDWSLEGPLTLGEAVSADARNRAEHAGPAPECADILVAPDAEMASTIHETLSWFTRCRFAALVAGAAAPILAASKDDSYDTRFNSIALASITARE